MADPGPHLCVDALLTCRVVKDQSPPSHPGAGPWVLDGLGHVFEARPALAGLSNVPPPPVLHLFARVRNLSETPRPHELRVHLYRRSDGPVGLEWVCGYRLHTVVFKPGIITYVDCPLPALPIPAADWYEFHLVLDDDGRTVVARAEVYLEL